ncbi:MAG: replicative DNA helicase [Spirochaetaceae bacterium]|nr:MAG: replicative DNA helicase [Spirochaetaceae bacterium]
MAEQTLKDKIPPHNEEAETATLGAMLLDPDAISEVIRYLRPDDFFKNAHKRVYQAILDLFNRGDAIDLITLTEELKTKNMLEGAGGATYLAELSSRVPTSANVEYYAKIVQECSIRRKLARVASEIIATSFEESRDVRMIIEEAEQGIFKLTEMQSSSNYFAAKDLVPKTIEAIERGYHTKESYTGIPSGFDVLDELTSGFQKSEFIVVGARPSVGKTAFALSMAANISMRQKRAVGFFTLEMSGMALIQRLLSSEARLNARKLRSGLLRPADFHSITEAAGKIYEAELYIEDSPNLKLLDLRALARRMKLQQDVDIIFIDYISLIQAENMELPRHEQIAEISRSLKALARELEIPVVALSQVKRETEGKRPALADLRESGSIEQDADVVIFLHRERQSDKKSDEMGNEVVTELIIAKQRNGPVGTRHVAFIPDYTRFEALANEPVM